MSPRRVLVSVSLWLLVAACHDPTAAQLNSAAPQSTLAAPAPPAAAPTSVVRPSASAPAAVSSSIEPAATEAPPPSAPVASSGAARQPADGDGPPSLRDADGKPLPQTDVRPTLDSASFQRRIATLAQAIVNGDPEPALGAFFPVEAYQQVKDVAKPERDYKFRLIANFKRDIAEYHKALGAPASGGAAPAKFEGVTVSEKDAKWMAPGAEGNKIGYFRVLRSRLRFTTSTGRPREFELTSMISWRGEWYVVHLHGFK